MAAETLLIREPHPARTYQTIGVPEEALQTFSGGSFVMSQANGTYIEYDGTSDPASVDIRYSPEQAHNYAVNGATRPTNLLEVLEKSELREIEITAYNGGGAATAALLQPGKLYGLTRLAANTTNNKTGKPIWVLDLTKTGSTLIVARITSINLRGFVSNGKATGFNTGTVGDTNPRVLVNLYR